MNILTKIRRKWTKLRLQPIRVFCLHHVAALFDAEWMYMCDFTQIDEFKKKVCELQNDGVEFISLVSAYQRICNDWFRCKKYAVLTFDDGYSSLKEILPWLEDQKIPATLFINGKYLDGKSYRKNPKEQYLTKEELFAHVSPLIEVGSHNWEHKDITKLSSKEQKNTIIKNLKVLSNHPCYISFTAYPYGYNDAETDAILLNIGNVPVLLDEEPNYNEQNVIHRQMMNSKR